MKNKIIIIFLILSTSFSYAQKTQVSKTGTTSGAFLEIGVGSFASGMGSASVALPYDASIIYWNPGGLSALGQNQFVLSHTSWLAETRFDFAGLALPIGDIGVLGFSYTALTMEDMKVRTVEMQEGTGEYFSAADFAVGLSIAKNLTDRFSIGFSFKYIQQSIWHMSANAIGFDAGTLFRTDLFNGMTIGASISNFGTPMKLAGRDTRTYARVDETKQGSNERIPYNIDLDSWDLPLLFRIGIATDVYKSEDLRVTVAMDALHPNNNYESLNLGGQISYMDFLQLRGGYRSLFLVDSEGGLSLGVGMNSKILFSQDLAVFDYAYQDFGRLKSIHTFSLGIKF